MHDLKRMVNIAPPPETTRPSKLLSRATDRNVTDFLRKATGSATNSDSGYIVTGFALSKEFFVGKSHGHSEERGYGTAREAICRAYEMRFSLSPISHTTHTPIRESFTLSDSRNASLSIVPADLLAILASFQSATSPQHYVEARAHSSVCATVAEFVVPEWAPCGA